jgi:pimeloyl-ACP methyl ester carboxylesterase
MGQSPGIGPTAPGRPNARSGPVAGLLPASEGTVLAATAFCVSAPIAETEASGRIVAVAKTPTRKRGQSLGALDARDSTSFRGMTGELCRILTEDGMELNGFYLPHGARDAGRRTRDSVPNPQPLAPNPSCVVHVHGWDGNFYENRFIDHVARVCAQQDIGFVSGNNRGHDYIADILMDRSRKAKAKRQKTKPAGGLDYIQIGGMYEKLTDSVADIKAWIDFAAGRGTKRIILQGHSHGAIKVTNYLSVTSDPRVSGLILLSPSDDMGLARKQLGERYLWVLARAREMVSKGSGRKLLPARDSAYPVSAATFFDCHNKSSMTGIFNMSCTDRTEFPELASVRVPVLMAVGTVEEAFVGKPRKYVAGVEKCMVNCPSFTGAVIKGAPHNYLGHERELATVLSKWLRRKWSGGPVDESRS